MRLLLVLLLLLSPVSAGAFSFATGGCATNGCETGDQLLASNLTEIDTALDSAETTITSHTSSISTLTATFSNYLPLAGGTVSGTVFWSAGSFLVVQTGSTLGPTGSGTIIATRMSSSGQVDDDDLAAGAVDLNTSEVSGTLPVANGGTGATALTNLITLSTHTTGNYVATIADSGASEITVSGSGSENAAVTLAIASTITRDSELANISAATSTNTAVAKFSGTSGDIQDSGVLIDSSNNVTIPGDITMGTSGTTCLMMTETDATFSECHLVAGASAITCTADADGVCDGT